MTPTSATYTLSLHDALPISCCGRRPFGVLAYKRRSLHAAPAPLRIEFGVRPVPRRRAAAAAPRRQSDRKSTRLNSSHRCTSYAVFCLKKKTYHLLDITNLGD